MSKYNYFMIRKINTITLYLAILVSCTNDRQQQVTTDLVQIPLTADKNSDKIRMPDIEVNQDYFDFGEIEQDKSIIIDFKLKNIGDAPLLIHSVKGSCGCTVPEWPKEVIEPGDDTMISVTFNSGKREGKQNKTVTLVTNAIPSTRVFTITGIVLGPKKN